MFYMSWLSCWGIFGSSCIKGLCSLCVVIKRLEKKLYTVDMSFIRSFSCYSRQHAYNASRILAIVQVSARPSVTLLICIKTVQKIFTMDCSKDFSFSWQNFVPLSEGVSLEQRRQIGQKRYFASSIMWKRLQIDRYEHVAYHNKHWPQAF